MDVVPPGERREEMFDGKPLRVRKRIDGNRQDKRKSTPVLHTLGPIIAVLYTPGNTFLSTLASSSAQEHNLVSASQSKWAT